MSELKPADLEQALALALQDARTQKTIQDPLREEIKHLRALLWEAATIIQRHHTSDAAERFFIAGRDGR